MFSRIHSIHSFLHREDPNPSNFLSSELEMKYKTFKKWLLENGAKFDKNIDFPFTYGPFHIVGVKCISEIDSGESILMIPRCLMMISSDCKEIEKELEELEDEFDDNDDLITLALTLKLFLENKKNDSFYRPYIDLIFLNKSIFSIWDEHHFSQMENENAENSIRSQIEEVHELYEKVIKIKRYEQMTYQEFSNCYSHVISRQFYLDDGASCLVPLADLLNHEYVKIKYEIYDSENFVFKYTKHFSNTEEILADMQPTICKDFPFNKPSYNRLKPFSVYGENSLEEEDEDDKQEHVEILKNDYFSIATSLNQKFSKGSQAFNNYNSIPNKQLLKYYGFSIIYNPDDYTNVIFYSKRGDLMLEKYFDVAFNDRFKTKADPIYNLLKFRVEFKDICIDLLKYFRFLYFYDNLLKSESNIDKKDTINTNNKYNESQNEMKKFFLYTFDYNLEKAVFVLSIDFLEKKLKEMEKYNNIQDEISCIEKEVFEGKCLDELGIYVKIYRVTQKINIKNQINLMKCVLNVLENHKDLKGYIQLSEYLNEFKDISEFDSTEKNKNKILRFISKMHKKVDPYIKGT